MDWKPVEALDNRCNGFPKANAAARQRALRGVGEVRGGLAIVATKMGRPGSARADDRPVLPSRASNVQTESERRRTEGSS
jgi:hypothetical protein